MAVLVDRLPSIKNFMHCFPRLDFLARRLFAVRSIELAIESGCCWIVQSNCFCAPATERTIGGIIICVAGYVNFREVELGSGGSVVAGGSGMGAIGSEGY